MTSTKLSGSLVLALAVALLGAGCDNSPINDRIYLPLSFFPCASVDPVTGAWASHPFPPLPDNPPPVVDAGPPPDAGSSADAGAAMCLDAGIAYLPDASPSGCEWMVLDRSTTVTLEHSLGRVPSTILVYISFEPDGRSSSLATGDSLLVRQSCAQTVTIRNDTNQRFFARVVLN